MANITSLAEQLVQGGTAGAFEPQRKNNWFFIVPGLIERPIVVALETGFAPTQETEEQELHFLNEKKFYAGKTSWAEGSLSLKDFVDRGSATAMINWQQKIYSPQTGAVNFAKVYKINCSVQLFGPDGTLDREWSLLGCWPKSVNYGELDMTSAEKVVIQASIRYDKAIPTKVAALAGVPVNTGGIHGVGVAV